MSAFDQIWGAQGNGRRGSGPALGRYRVRIMTLKEKQGFKGHSFIVEARIIESKKTDNTVEPTPVGASVSFVMNMSKPGSGGDAAKGNAKDIVACVFASLGVAPTKAAYETLLAKNSARGVDCEIDGYTYTIQGGANAGKPMVLFTWSPIPHTTEQVLRQRAELGDGAAPPAAPAAPSPAQTSAPAPAPKAEPTAAQTAKAIETVDDILAGL